MIKRCGQEGAVQEAFTERRPEDVAAHLEGCEACAEEWSRLEEIAEAARAVRTPELSKAAKDEIRARLLVGARALGKPSAPPATRRRWLRSAVIGLALAAAAAVALKITLDARPNEPAVVQTAETPPTPVRRGTVRGHHDAAFTTMSEQPDEVVYLYEGTITVEVDHLAPGERFRVLTKDAEVEVVGTMFDVTAESGRLTAVRVIRGRVELHSPEHADAVLSAGQRWQAPPPVDDVQPANSVASSHPAPSAAPRVPRAPSAAELAFRKGWAALRDGDAASASEAFANVPADAPLAPDAAFWGGVALARAGKTTAAIGALERFVREHPSSPHAAQARVMLEQLRSSEH